MINPLEISGLIQLAIPALHPAAPPGLLPTAVAITSRLRFGFDPDFSGCPDQAVSHPLGTYGDLRHGPVIPGSVLPMPQSCPFTALVF
jgi:hypothetical protein